MTEQEAEALAARLTRIWGPDSPPSAPKWELDTEKFEFKCQIEVQVFVNVALPFAAPPFASMWWGDCEMAWRPDGFHPFPGRYCTPEDWDELMPRFTVQGLPLFRRGLWLSGLPIEASAHEKAEWMQGFTREELEAWNLKM